MALLSSIIGVGASVVGGGVVARLPLSTLRGKMFSLTGIILATLAEEKTKSREYRKARRNILNKYNQKKIESLQNKYLTKSRKKLDSKSIEIEIKKMMQDFKKDHGYYIKTFMDIVTQVVKTFDAANMKEAEIVDFYPQLRADLEAYIGAHPDQKIFPEKATKKFREVLDNVLKDLVESLHKELALMSLERRTQPGGLKRMLGSAFPTFANIKRAMAESRGTREASTLGKEVKQYEDIRNAILSQIATGGEGIRQNFLMLLLHYAVLCERVFGSVEKIKNDVLIIMRFMDKDIVTVERELARFLLFVQADPTIRVDVARAKNDFDLQYVRVRNYLIYEESRVTTLGAKVEALKSADVPDKIAKILTMNEEAAQALSDTLFHARTQHLVHRKDLIPGHPLNS
ncbi:hypothetical protein HYT52_05320 [Candidatus Woesearchaeota archaeon]|nr:hypothetical protein [Candidatus Woesearchaeota archaeon]